MNTEYKPGELFVYTNGDRWELGIVKCKNSSGDGYFCWYHRGDTAANTPLWCMHKLANAGWTHIEQQMDDLREALCAAWKCVHAGISCSDCRLIAGGCTLQTTMRELGIEVGE